MLEISGLHTGYGEKRVLHGVDLTVGEGEVVTLLGRNGAGKTTTLKAVMSLLPAMEGEIRFDGRPLKKVKTYDLSALGLSFVPENRGIFPSLSVRENLELTRSTRREVADGWTMERVFEFFPRLRERLDNGGSQLSGGEQQMLAIARGLLLNPKLLILDEPTEGLAPIVVKQIHERLMELKKAGLSILLVEQNFGFATTLADRAFVLGRGEIQWSGPSGDLRGESEIQHRWLGV
ncbi:branched-chain amino acid transport system ATP-binding protein [Rhodobium orientis]|uniref:ABC transporter ATP-binding protein n=1 Tax=Rhodobium orientis TaxID=34017 RepID=A0A327JDV9_9HYPH|nr:ABC transporter ATP-binding protein [Rhodobium orientis]MBB4305700.1 branched-chain amino acid transport system ATP-binding protein [Rhodobium orientis]MBK5947885.1 ABC transporter ATP-binding protein [Rhodobium orientis]RAI24312.1 ABC transporter ATP-binding protein [Rhodobium orientis]